MCDSAVGSVRSEWTSTANWDIESVSISVTGLSVW